MLQFLMAAFREPKLFLVFLLILAVILVNGWTDAPNTIATCVTTGAMKQKAAIRMSALFNFFGVFLITRFNGSVVMTIYHIVDFRGETAICLTALCAAMMAIVFWAVFAWYFGVPTSESHAMVAALSGAAIALQKNGSGVQAAQWYKVMAGLLLSSGLAFGAGYALHRLGWMEKQPDVRNEKMQKICAAGMSFLHGAQDGQKFIGLFLLAWSLLQGKSGNTFQVPLWLVLLCSITMALGTGLGGGRILNKIGARLVPLSREQGVQSDMAAILSLVVCSLLGLPVSTTHTRSFGVMGVGMGTDQKPDKKSAAELVLAWMLTFPGCGLIGFGFARLISLLP